jgi:UDP-N-acetylglucosamine 2-epimerase (non-hydrolysing)
MNNHYKKYAVIVGTRPNFIKAAPFFIEAQKHSNFKFTLIHTGQHFDDNMSKNFFDEMKIPRPDFFLDVKSDLYTEKLGKIFNKLTNFFKNKQYNGVVVFGDVNSTLAGAIAAIKNKLSLIHIEAGLRSYDRRMPEEINRVIVDHLSDLLFTTEPSANENLIREGIPERKIKYVGNIMIESLEIFKDKIASSPIIEKLRLKEKQYIIATIHRQENIDSIDMIKKIFNLLNSVNKKLPIIIPLHPGTKKKISEFKLDYLIHNLKIIPPLGYFDFMKLVNKSRGVITDSGGIQEETTYLGIPCCTLRDNTERPITLSHGSNKLFPIATSSSKELLEHLNRNDFHSHHIPLWDNKVSQRIFAALK